MFQNQMEGTLPTELGDLSDLLALYLDSNKLNGTIPNELSRLTSLVDLRLGVNQFTGTLPTELGRLTKLEVRSIQGRRNGVLLLYICLILPFLKTLYLDTNRAIIGRIPTEFGNLIKATGA